MAPAPESGGLELSNLVRQLGGTAGEGEGGVNLISPPATLRANVVSPDAGPDVNESHQHDVHPIESPIMIDTGCRPSCDKP